MKADRPSVPEPTYFDVEIDIEKQKSYESPSTYHRRVRSRRF